MKLLIDGEYKDVGVMSFVKCVAISQIIILIITLAISAILLI